MSFLLSLALVAPALAQMIPSDLAQCAQTCIRGVNSNMVSQFGCTDGDVACYCSNAEYGYGVRDCTTVVCDERPLADAAIAYAVSLCASAASANPSASEALPGLTGTGSMPTATDDDGAPSTSAGGPLSTIITTVDGAEQTLVVLPDGTTSTVGGSGGSDSFSTTITTTVDGETFTVAVGPSATSTIGGDDDGDDDDSDFSTTLTTTVDGETFTVAVGPSTTSTITDGGDDDDSSSTITGGAGLSTITTTSDGMTYTLVVSGTSTSTLGGGDSTMTTVTETETDATDAPTSTGDDGDNGAAMQTAGALVGAAGVAALLLL